MSLPETPSAVFISCHSADRGHATALESLLPEGTVIWNGATSVPSGAEWGEALRDALIRADVTVVLLGPRTRDSRWVDFEIQHSTAARSTEVIQAKGQAIQSSVLSAWGIQPGAGLVGIILPDHPDFSKPYYDPENVPVRLHDLVQQEYAIIKKWTYDAGLIAGWLLDAVGRRRYRHPERTPRLVEALTSFSWDDSLDSEKAAFLRHEPLAR